MKKILFAGLFVILGLAGMSQDFEGIVGLKMLDSDTVVVDSTFIITGDTLRATTQVSIEDDTIATKAYVDAGGATGVTILDFDKLTGISSIKLAGGTVVDTADMNGRYGLLTTDTLIVRNDSLLLGNDYGVPLTALGIDSISQSVDSTNLLWTYWYVGGVLIDSSSYDLSQNYLAISDSTKYITPSKLDDTLSYYTKIDEAVYNINLPIAGTLAGSVAAAVEGTDYPTGWVLSASGGDLLVTHNTGRYTAVITVSYNSTGTTYRQLVSYQTAYNTILSDENSATIISISQFYTGYKLKLNIVFD